MVDAGQQEFSNTEEYLRAAEEIAGPYLWGRYDILLLPPSFPYGGMENPCLTFATPTLLAGDRSLTTVIAHEIAHSWTGNLVTNRTWEHFWLNEGCNVFLERKIIKRVCGDDHFNLVMQQGKDDLMSTCERIGEEHNFTCLVWDLSGGKDPDDAFSRIPYEKGCYFNVYLERLAGGAEKYEEWFRNVWISGNAHKTVDSNDFKNSYTEAFPEAAAQVDWNAWFNTPGKPKVDITYDDKLSIKAKHLAQSWCDAGENAEYGELKDIEGWPSVCVQLFLDVLKSSQPLPKLTCERLGEVYGFNKCRNSEERFRWYEVAMASANETVLPAIVQFITEQGRMKFVRPLYRSLLASDIPGTKELALETFARVAASYNPITRKMVQADLKLRTSNVVEA